MQGISSSFREIKLYFEKIIFHLRKIEKTRKFDDPSRNWNIGFSMKIMTFQWKTQNFRPQKSEKMKILDFPEFLGHWKVCVPTYCRTPNSYDQPRYEIDFAQKKNHFKIPFGHFWSQIHGFGVENPRFCSNFTNFGSFVLGAQTELEARATFFEKL